MLITRLADYARENNLVDDPLFEHKRVHFTLTLARDGSFMQIAPTEGTRGVVGVTPKKAGKNAPSVPAFGTDKASFVFGLANVEAGAAKAERDLAAFAQLTHTAATARPDLATFGAADRFYADQARVLAARQQARTVGVKESHIVAIAMVEDMGVWLANTAAGKSFWRDHRAIAMIGKPTAGAVACLSCGRASAPVRTADTKIVGLLPPPPGDGRTLVSFDKDAFQSHGWDKNANAAVCEECSQAYTRGLNHLLKRDNSPKTRIDEGGVAFVAWAGAAPPSNGADREAVDLEELLRGMEQGLLEVIDEPNTDHAIAVFRAISSGKPLVGEPDRRLYVLGLRGNGGRAVVVDWFDVALGDAYANILRWFKDLQIQLIFDQYHTSTDRATKEKRRELVASAGDESRPIPRWMLGKATVREGEEVPKHLSAALIRAALKGDPLPLTVAEAAMTRLRLEKNGFGDYLATARIGLIRCTLNRHLRKAGKSEEEVPVTSEPTIQTAAYNAGQLFEHLEYIQNLAAWVSRGSGDGSLNRPIGDRYFRSMSTNPGNVVTLLLRLAKSHISVIRRHGRPGAAHNMDERMWSLAALAAGAGALNSVEQMQFILGYSAGRAARRIKLTPLADQGSDDAPPADNPIIEAALDDEERAAAPSATTSTTTGDPQ